MDTITHGIVGIGLAIITGEPLALTNPAFIGCLAGAVIPDSDIVMQFGGHHKYLKNHRGISHSLLFTVLYTIIISGVLFLFFPDMAIKRVAMMTLLGILSHLSLDLANPYGAALFSPFSKKKITVDLLLVFDPVIAIIFGLIIVPATRNIFTSATLVVFLLSYLGFRFLLKYKATDILLKKILGKYEILSLRVLPSMTGYFKWHFVARTKKGNVVGEINVFRQKVKIVEELKNIDEELFEMALSTPVAEYFREFTPYFHVRYEKTPEGILFRFIDLRYFVAKEYLHNGTALVSVSDGYVHGEFHPYRMSRSIAIE